MDWKESRSRLVNKKMRVQSSANLIWVCVCLEHFRYKYSRRPRRIKITAIGFVACTHQWNLASPKGDDPNCEPKIAGCAPNCARRGPARPEESVTRDPGRVSTGFSSNFREIISRVSRDADPGPQDNKRWEHKRRPCGAPRRPPNHPALPAPTTKVAFCYSPGFLLAILLKQFWKTS